MHKRVAVVFALDQEVRPFRLGLAVRRRQSIGTGELSLYEYRGGELALVRTGVGGRNIIRALDELSAVWRPNLLILIGFTGAADPQFRTSQVVLPHTIITTSGQTIAVTAAGLAVIPGAILCTMVTVTRVYHHADKQRLFQEQGPGRVVDMESGFLAAWALEHRTPFAIIKAISDTYQFILPSGRFLTKFFEHPAAGALIKQAFRHPFEVYRLARLNRNCREAAINLKTALDDMLKYTPAGPTKE
jgi:adenosylhomocysteine nucleosidase